MNKIGELAQVVERRIQWLMHDYKNFKLQKEVLLRVYPVF